MIIDVGAWRIYINLRSGEKVNERQEARNERAIKITGTPGLLSFCHSLTCDKRAFCCLHSGHILHHLRCKSSSPVTCNASNLDRIHFALSLIDTLGKNGCRSSWPSLRRPGDVFGLGVGKPGPDHPGPTHNHIHAAGFMHTCCYFGE